MMWNGGIISENLEINSKLKNIEDNSQYFWLKNIVLNLEESPDIAMTAEVQKNMQANREVVNFPSVHSYNVTEKD